MLIKVHRRLISTLDKTPGKLLHGGPLQYY